MPSGPGTYGTQKGRPHKKTKPKNQMPDHTYLVDKLRQRRNKTNEAIQFMRGYRGK